MRRAAALALIVASLFAADARGDGGPSGAPRALRPLWRRDDLGEVVRGATPKGLVVAADSKGGLVTVDAGTGRTLKRWRLPVEAQPGAALVVGEHLVVSEGESVRSFDVRTGKAEWRRKLGCRFFLQPESSQGVVVGNCVRAPAHLYVFRDLVVALDVEAGGKELWRRKAAEKQINQKHGLELAVGSDRVAFEDLIAGPKVQLVALRTGEVTRTLAVRAVTTLSFEEEILLIGSLAEQVPGEAVAAYDARTGVELWRQGPRLGWEDSWGLPRVVGEAAWLRSGNELIGVDARTGDERTRVKLSEAAGTVYAWRAEEGLVMAVSARNDIAPTQVLLAADARATELTMAGAARVVGVAGKVLLAAPIGSSPRSGGLMAFQL